MSLQPQLVGNSYAVPLQTAPVEPDYMAFPQESPEDENAFLLLKKTLSDKIKNNRVQDQQTDKSSALARHEVVPAKKQLQVHSPAGDEALQLPALEGPKPMTPAGKIGAQATGPKEKSKAKEPAPSLPAAKPDSLHRLPVVVANIPSPIRTVPEANVKPSTKQALPSANQRDASSGALKPKRAKANRNVDDSWREPETLLESLSDLVAAKPTNKWTTEVVRLIRTLGPVVAGGSDESTAILERLTDLRRQASELAKTIPDRTLARKLCKAGHALNRRLDVWQQVVRLGVPQPTDSTVAEVDPHKLATCLAEVDSLIAGSAQGQAWRKYLLLDALKESAKQRSAEEDRITRQLAAEVLERLIQTPLTPNQHKFVTTGPVAALRAELRHWAAEPIGATALLRDIETYERTGLPSDARRLAFDRQHLGVSPTVGRRQLAERVEMHYRNANLRIAITEELLNKLIPERNLEYAPVDDTVLGRPVWGESLMASEVAVRMMPDAHRVRLALEVSGEISALTTADAGPARFHNDSQSYYLARKPLEIDMDGISLWPVEVGVENQTRLRGVETPLDGVPLIGPLAKGVARSQLSQNTSAATEEVKQKIAAQARQRVDAEIRQRLKTVVEYLNQRVFDPLNSLALDPQMVSAETTEERFTMRLRLAGEDQLGSHTPRPQALAGSLASVQIHESLLNNGIQRLQLDGRTFTLPELSQHIANRLARPAPWEIDPEHTSVKIAFAKKDAVVVRCEDGKVILTLSIAELAEHNRLRRKWKDFQVQAFYRPEVKGRSAQLVREGAIHLPKTSGTQLALRTIFSKALSKNNSWELVPERIVKEPKLSDMAITQFVIDDGWIAAALGPKTPSPATATSLRSRRGLQ